MVSNKARKRVPPSRIRYEKQNPTLTIRLDRASYDKLRAFQTRTGRPLGSLVKEALQVMKPMTTQSTFCWLCAEDKPDVFSICPDCIRDYVREDEINELLVDMLWEYANMTPGQP